MRFPKLYSRAAWPPPLLIWLFIAAYAMWEFLVRIAALIFDVRYNSFSLTEIKPFLAFVLGTAAGLSAVFHLVRFHPICNRDYAMWLKSSPWTHGKPLPLGPIYPMLNDAVVLGILTALATWHARVDPALPIVVYGLTYLISLSLLLFLAFSWRICALLGFLWPALLLPETGLIFKAAVFGAIAVFTWIGHVQLLRNLPFEKALKLGPVAATDIQFDLSPYRNVKSVGWPYNILSPSIKVVSVSIPVCLCISALAGWWTFCLSVRYMTSSEWPFMVLFGFIAAFFRYLIYRNGVAPPFNLGGRLASGRLIVPGFDKILAGPIALFAVGCIGGLAVHSAGSSYKIVQSCVVALIVFILFGAGPTLRSWILTGQNRFTPPMNPKQGRDTLAKV